MQTGEFYEKYLQHKTAYKALCDGGEGSGSSTGLLHVTDYGVLTPNIIYR